MRTTRKRIAACASAILLLACTVTCIAHAAASASSPASSSSFEETLLLRPLHDGKLLMHFEFTLAETGNEGGSHFALFPKSLGQILSRFGVRSLALSLSSGRWMPESFGYESMDAVINSTGDDSGSNSAGRFTPLPIPLHAPHGAELWAVLDDEDVEEEEGASSGAASSAVRGTVDSRWHQLQAALSGLFCASLNQMGALTSSHPERIIRPAASEGDSIGSFRYATLPRESVCTENLAPFVKLLPCRSKRGLGALLNPLKLYRAHFHSIQIRVEPITDTEGSVQGWMLRQSVSALIDSALIYHTPNWSLSQLLGAGGACACSLSKRASLHVHLPAAFSARFPESVQALHAAAGSAVASTASSSHARFQLSTAADLVRRSGSHSLLSYDLKTHSASNLSRWPACPRGSIDLAMSYTPAAAATGREAASVFERRDLEELLALHSQQQPFEHPIEVQRYISSSTLHSGVLHIHLHNPSASRSTFHVQLFDALPYFCQIAYSTLRITLDGSPLPPSDLLDHSYSPAVLRGSPAQLFFSFRLRANSTLSFSIDFSKELLTANDYPPDVSRGFDIGSAIVSVQRMEPEGNDPTADSPRVVFYTSGLLLLLPFPDFSMPFNVIAFTSTVLAFFWGSLFNMSYGSYEQVLKRKPKRERDEQGKPVTIASNIKKMFCKTKKLKDANATTAAPSEVQLTAVSAASTTESKAQ